MKPATIRRSSLLGIALALPFTSTVSALDLFWNASPLANTWDTSLSNWSLTSGGTPNQVWSAASNATFDQAETYTVTLTGAQTIGTMNVSAGTVSIAGTGTSSSNNIVVATGATLITAPARIQKAGATSIEINGTLNLGTANFSSGNFLQPSGNGTLYGGFRYSGTSIFGGNIVNPSGGTSSIVWNAGSPGTLTLSGDNNGMSGQLLMSISGSTLKLNSANALGSNAYLNLFGTNTATDPSLLVELSAANLTRAWATGSAAAGGGGVTWASHNSGFYATGADRSLTFTTTPGGATPADVIWGSNGLTSSTVVLGAAAATHKVTWTNNINLNAAARTFNVGNGAGEVDAALSGNLSGATGSLVKAGTGTLELSGNNTFGSGTFNYGADLEDRGAIRLASATALGAHSTINLVGGAASVRQIQLSGGNTYAYNLTLQGVSNQTTSGASLVNISGDNTWNGSINMALTGGGYGIRADAGSSLTLKGNLGGSIVSTTARNWDFHGAGDIIVDGAISNNTGATVRVIKSGEGTLTLNAANSYSNVTNVNEGTLILNGSIGAGTVTVASATTLGGSGSMAGNLTVQAAGELRPGNSAGSLQVGGASILLAANSTTFIELGGTDFTLNGIEDYDRVKFANATATLDLTDSILNVTLLDPFTLVQNQAFGIMQLQDGATRTGTFATLANNGDLVGNFGGVDLFITYSGNFGDSGTVDVTGGNDIVLYTIPEPSAALLGSLGMFVLLRRRRF